MMTSMSADLAAYNRQRANEFKEVFSYFYLNLCLLHGIAEVCVDLSLTTSTAPCMSVRKYLRFECDFFPLPGNQD